jgi:hypothetical protein
MKITGKPQLPATFPASVSTKTLKASPDSDLQYKSATTRRPARRLARTPTRLRRPGAPSGRRSRPETPLLRWSVDGGNRNDRVEEDQKSARECRRRTHRRGQDEVVVSARKLAAGLWRLQIPEVAAGAGGARLGLQVSFACLFYSLILLSSFLFVVWRSVIFRFICKLCECIYRLGVIWLRFYLYGELFVVAWFWSLEFDLWECVWSLGC